MPSYKMKVSKTRKNAKRKTKRRSNMSAHEYRETLSKRAKAQDAPLVGQYISRESVGYIQGQYIGANQVGGIIPRQTKKSKTLRNKRAKILARDRKRTNQRIY